MKNKPLPEELIRKALEGEEKGVENLLCFYAPYIDFGSKVAVFYRSDLYACIDNDLRQEIICGMLDALERLRMKLGYHPQSPVIILNPFC